MALKSSADVGFLLLGGKSVLAAPLKTINETRERLMEQSDGLGDSDDKWSPVGVGTFEMTQEGFFDSGTNLYHQALEAADPQVLMYAPLGNVIGDHLTGLSAVRTSYAVLPARGAFHKANATYRAETGPEKLGNTRITAHHVARTTAGPTDTASYNWLASSANGGVGYLGVSALTLGGYTSVTVAIRDSTDDITFADLITFTAVTAAPTAERKTVTGTIDQYTLTRHTFNGAGTGQSITFACGLGRN